LQSISGGDPLFPRTDNLISDTAPRPAHSRPTFDCTDPDNRRCPPATAARQSQIGDPKSKIPGASTLPPLQT
jgi:hypothetical protein